MIARGKERFISALLCICLLLGTIPSFVASAFSVDDPAQSFTLSDIAGQNVEMENARISIEHFVLEGKNESNDKPCKLHFPEDLEYINGGFVKDEVQPTVENNEGKLHAFSHAHVGNTPVYYIGMLTTYDGNKPEQYIYYTTDKQITNKTVFAVLKENEKISLVYDHGDYYTVDYKFQDSKGQAVENGPDGWTLDDVFGADRVRIVGKNHEVGVTVTIPRGYQATATFIGSNGSSLLSREIGKMMSYHKNEGQNNTIWKDEGSPDFMKLTESFSGKPSDNITVIVRYEKVDKITFNARMWTTTNYAGSDYKGSRIKVKNNTSGALEAPNDTNSILTTSDHSFTWEFDGVTSKDGQLAYTWEMDQLEINGERIRVPMINLADVGPDKKKETITELSTGTVITFSVESLGGTNGKDASRHYTLQADNCYENLTITGGNMVSHPHKEFVMRRLEGIASGGYWTDGGTQWKELRQNTLIAKTKGYKNDDPIKVKAATGYQNVHVSFTTKENETIQADDNTASYGWTAINYLIRTDTVTMEDVNNKGAYKIVPYEQWTVSDDGYYYFCGTDKLDAFMKQENKNGIILINVYTDPIKSGIDYKNGAGNGITGPRAENIENLPQYQDGGKNGYNIKDNPVALVSNQVPTDKTGKFVFDYWEILIVENDQPSSAAKMDESGKIIEVRPGMEIPVKQAAINKLEDCLYYNTEKERSTLTFRAAWRVSAENEPIPYIVRYILVDIDGSETWIEEHTHTVNVGAMLVTNLYKDLNKTLADSITGVLKGDNNNQMDYTLNGNWTVDENRSTKRIPRVTPENNLATIYLLKQTTSVTVTKKWEDYNSPTRPASVEVQLYKNGKPFGAPVTLSAENWSHIFTRLPEIENGEPIVYTAQEVTVPDGYISEVKVSADAPDQIIITNTKKTGNLTVSKTVSGNLGDTNQEFTFTVTLDDHSIEGQYGDMVFYGGVATFRLKHGESIAASALSADIHYVVKESGNEGYTVTVSGGTGMIEEGQTAAAKFNNHKEGSTLPPPVNPEPDKPPKPDPDVPGSSKPITPSPVEPTEPSVPTDTDKPTTSTETGDNSNFDLWLTLLFVSGGGLICTSIYGKKRK